MMANEKADVTNLLRAWGAGDRSTEEKLWPLVFAELKRIARRHLAHETAGSQPAVRCAGKRGLHPASGSRQYAVGEPE